MLYPYDPDWDPEPEIDPEVCWACRTGQFGCTCGYQENFRGPAAPRRPDPKLEDKNHA